MIHQMFWAADVAAPSPPPPVGSGNLLVYDYLGFDPDPTLNEPTAILNYYDAGADGQGIVGPAYGVVHQSNIYRWLDYPAGGLLNCANSPSKDWSILPWDGVAPAPAATTYYISKSAGWTGFVSFAYASTVSITVDVYDGVNATGALLASQSFGTTSVIAASPSNQDWAQAVVSFSGTAKSVRISCTNIYTIVDSISLGEDAVYGNLPATTLDISLAGGTASITYKADGTIAGTGFGVGQSFLGAWFSRPLALIGTNYWIRCTVLAGSVASGTTGSWLQLSSDRAWTVTSASTRLQFEIATDALGVTIVASTANNTPERNHVFFQA